MLIKIIYNIDWVKENVFMLEFLRCFGYQFVYSVQCGNELWYIFLFCYEREFSFYISYIGGKWIWNDFGCGDVQGKGIVIGFMQLYENIDVKGVLQLLKNMFFNWGRVVLLEVL